MKKNILFLALLMSTTLFAQVGIGTQEPHPSSILELKSDHAGLILPRLKTANIDDPQMGTIVYDTEKNQICVFTTKWNCYSNMETGNDSGLSTNTLFRQSDFLNINGTFVFGNGLKNQNKTIDPSTSKVTPFVSPCNGQCDGSSFGMVESGDHILGFSLRRGNNSVAGNYVVLRILVDGRAINEAAFNFPNMSAGEVIPFQFEFSCPSRAQIQIQAGNGLNDAGILFNYLQTKNTSGI